MRDFELGSLRFTVEQRSAASDGGPCLRVFGAEDGHQLLRFDCFERAPHWHADPTGKDEITPLDPSRDPVGWTIAELGRDLSGYLARAGCDAAEPVDPRELAATLREVELAMRNPPADLDALDVEKLRLRTGEKWTQYGDEVLPAWVADMDFPVAAPIRSALRRALDLDDLGYPVNPKPHALPTLFAERMQRRFGWSVDPRRVDVIIDVVQGIFVGLEVYCEPGEGVVIQPPIYPPFFGAIRETGRRVVSSPLVEGTAGYEIDFDHLRAAAGESRVLLLSHPHNPSGRVFTRPELERIADIALEHDLVVLSDEIHADLVYAGHRHVPFATLSPEVEARTVTLTSATKAFNIAGLRCAVAHFGSPELKRTFLRIPRHTRGGINTFGMAATAAAWRFGQPWLDQVLAYLDGNRHLISEFLRKHLPAVRYFPPESTYLAWLDCRALDLEGGPYRFFLDRARVGLSDGTTFGPEGEGFVRLNFATSRAILTQILERMAKAVQAEAR